MPSQTTFPTMEVAIIVVNLPDDPGGERLKAGDIVDLRNPLSAIGSAETTRFLWLLLDGLEADEWLGLAGNLTDPLRGDAVEFVDPDNVTVWDKRRYRVPLNRLVQVAPYIDIDRVEDPGDPYQPFRLLDEEKHVLKARKPLLAQGLIFDKALGVYL